MSERFELTQTIQGRMAIAHKGAVAVIDAEWVSLGGCTSHMTALRVYLALKVGGGR